MKWFISLWIWVSASAFAVEPQPSADAAPAPPADVRQPPAAAEPADSGRRILRGGRGFDKFDADQDGLLSREEAARSPRPGLRRNFGRIDADGDGQVSRPEHRAYARKRRALHQRRPGTPLPR